MHTTADDSRVELANSGSHVARNQSGSTHGIGLGGVRVGDGVSSARTIEPAILNRKHGTLRNITDWQQVCERQRRLQPQSNQASNGSMDLSK